MIRRHGCFDCSQLSPVGVRELSLRVLGWRVLSRSAPAGAVFVWVCPDCSQPANVAHGAG